MAHVAEFHALVDPGNQTQHDFLAGLPMTTDAKERSMIAINHYFAKEAEFISGWDWDKRFQDPPVISFSGLEKILREEDLKYYKKKFEYRIEILGSTFKVIENCGGHKSLYFAISQALTGKESYASKVKEFIDRHLETNWPDFVQGMHETYADQLESLSNENSYVYEVLDEYRKHLKTNAARGIELFAAARLFKFSFCRITAYQNNMFIVCNANDPGSLIKFYFLETEDNSPYFQLLIPMNNYHEPKTGSYNFNMKKVLVFDDSSKKKLSKKYLSPRVPDHLMTLLIGSEKQEFALKDNGIYSNTLFNNLGHIVYGNACIHDKMKAYLDSHRTKEEIETHNLKHVRIDKHYAEHLLYLELAGNVFGFNFGFFAFNPLSGDYDFKFRVIHPEDANVRWFYFLLAEQNWYQLHLMDDLAKTTEKLITMKNYDPEQSEIWHMKESGGFQKTFVFPTVPLEESKYREEMDTYQRNISYVFNGYMKYYCFIMKDEFKQIYPEEQKKIKLRKHLIPRWEVGKGKNSRSLIIPGTGESIYQFVDHKGRPALFLPYLFADKTDVGSHLVGQWMRKELFEEIEAITPIPSLILPIAPTPRYSEAPTSMRPNNPTESTDLPPISPATSTRSIGFDVSD